MPELIRVEGTSGGFGVSRDDWPEDAQFVQAIFQQDHPLGDDEANLIQQVGEYNLKKFVAGLISDGLLSGGQLVFPNTLSSPPANTFYMQEAFWTIDHYPVVVANSANNGTTLSLNNAIEIVLAAPPTGATPRTDLAFLEFWFEEIAAVGQTNASTTVYERGGEANGSITNSILNAVLSTELARRVQMKWRIRTVSGSSTVNGQTAWGAVLNNGSSTYTFAHLAGGVAYRAGPTSSDVIHAQGTLTGANILETVNGFSYAIPIATINRNPNITTLDPTTVITGPPVATLNASVPVTNIYPQLPNPLPGADLYPSTILYEGTVGDSTSASGIVENPLNTQSLATSFTITAPAGATGASGFLSRVELHVGARGTGGLGSDFTVQIVTDHGGQPTGTVVSSVLVPKEWLLPTARYLSIPVNCTVLWGTKYWIVLQETGSASGFVSWIGEVSIPATVRSLSTTGSITSTWPTSIPNLHMSAIIDNVNGPAYSSSFALNPGGLTGTIRNTVEGTAPALTVSGFDYDTIGIANLLQVAYSSVGAIVSASLVQVDKNPSTGSIEGLTELNSR